MIDYEEIDPSLHELVKEMNELEGVATIGSWTKEDGAFTVDFICAQNEMGWFDLSLIAGLTGYEGNHDGSLFTAAETDEDLNLFFTLYGDETVAADRVAMWLRGQDEKRTCAACGRDSVTVGLDEHDACIAELPGVKFACCGHLEDDGRPYLVEDDDLIYRGQEALDRMRALGGDPPAEITGGQLRALNLYRLGFPPSDQPERAEIPGPPLDREWDFRVEAFIDQMENDEIGFVEQLPEVRRIAWEYENGCQIPRGYWLRHECDTRECVNPAHAVLEPVDA